VKTFVGRRLLYSALVVLIVSMLVFLMLHLSGDPITLLAPPGASPEFAELLRSRYGLDKPLWTQYWIFLTNVVTRGDFGESYYYNVSAIQLVLARFQATIELASSAMLVAILVAFPLGVTSAIRYGTWADHLTRFLVLLGQAAPPFWVGILLILLFSVHLGWFPASGREGLSTLVLPATTLGAFTAAMFTRLIRASMLDVLTEDYVRTARAKGLLNTSVLLKHALRNALIPVVTTMGIVFGFLLGGAIVTETVFAWPGLGRLLVHAIQTRDFPLVQAAVFVYAVTFVILNFLVDVIYGFIDPRIKHD